MTRRSLALSTTESDIWSRVSGKMVDGAGRSGQEVLTVIRFPGRFDR